MPVEGGRRKRDLFIFFTFKVIYQGIEICDAQIHIHSILFQWLAFDYGINSRFLKTGNVILILCSQSYLLLNPLVYFMLWPNQYIPPPLIRLQSFMLLYLSPYLSFLPGTSFHILPP